MVPRSKKGASRKAPEGDEAGRGDSKGGGAAKAKATTSKRPSRRGATQEARERAARLAPSDAARVIAADPLRAQIVAVALQRLYSPSEFAKDAGIALNVASYAFKVLKDHGVLELVKEEKVKGATIKHMYRATEAALVNEADWGQLADALRPGLVGTTLHDFTNRVTQAMETGRLFTREDFYLYWAPQDLDEIAWKEQVGIICWAIEATKQLVVDTANRRANGESEGSFHATFAISAFPSPTHEEVTKHRGKAKLEAKQEAAKGRGKAAGRRRERGRPKAGETGATVRRGVVEHDVRLDILRCLSDGEPLTLSQVSGRVSRRLSRVAYHVGVLDSAHLVGRRRSGSSGPMRYVAQLDEQPAWVEKAVKAHRSPGKAGSE